MLRIPGPTVVGVVTDGIVDTEILLSFPSLEQEEVRFASLVEDRPLTRVLSHSRSPKSRKQFSEIVGL
jgi:hypothetical protein